MSFDPGPLRRVQVPPGTPEPLARAFSDLQANVADWCDRLRKGEGWNDLQGTATEGLSTSSLTAQEVPASTGALYQCFRHDQTDDLTYVKQFTHRWAGGGVRPHIHVMPLADASGSLALSWKYAWLPVGGKLSGYTDMGEILIPLTAGDRYEHIIAPLGHIEPPDDLSLTSAFLIVFVERNRDGGDTYTSSKGWGTLAANVALLGMDTHNRERLFGSEGEYR